MKNKYAAYSVTGYYDSVLSNNSVHVYSRASSEFEAKIALRNRYPTTMLTQIVVRKVDYIPGEYSEEQLYDIIRNLES